MREGGYDIRDIEIQIASAGTLTYLTVDAHSDVEGRGVGHGPENLMRRRALRAEAPRRDRGFPRRTSMEATRNEGQAGSAGAGPASGAAGGVSGSGGGEGSQSKVSFSPSRPTRTALILWYSAPMVRLWHREVTALPSGFGM